MKLFFQIFLLLFSKKLCFHIIKLPFIKYSKYIEGNNYIDYLEKNDVAVIFEIGNPIQSIPIFLNFDVYPFYISRPDLNGIYNEIKSYTFEYKNQ